MFLETLPPAWSKGIAWLMAANGYLKNESESKIQFTVPAKFYLMQICLYVPFPKSFSFSYNFKCFYTLNFMTKGV